MDNIGHDPEYEYLWESFKKRWEQGPSVRDLKLRDLFAIAIMNGFCSDPSLRFGQGWTVGAQQVYAIADRMVAARDAEGIDVGA